MKNKIAQFVRFLFLTIIIVSLCLSCANKRELKKYLEIPVPAENVLKPNQGTICVTFTAGQSTEDTKIRKAVIQKYLRVGSGFNITYIFKQPKNRKTVVSSIVSSLPLFIFHEQYRI